MKASRRHFLRHAAAVPAGFFGLSQYVSAAKATVDEPTDVYGPLIEDPHRILDLPRGFSYRVLSWTGDLMTDGFVVPGAPDGMAAFPGDGGKVILVRNHELSHSQFELGPFKSRKRELPKGFDPELSFDPGRFGEHPFVGGTTSVIWNPVTREVEQQYLSLTGTDRNCAGGPTPWGSWITCEEPADTTSKWGVHHGYCFEVKASAKPGVQKPVPLKGLGRFRHEAVAVHPATGVLYLTEDRPDSLIYRFLPSRKGDFTAPGRLQALKVVDQPGAMTRNWPQDEKKFPLGQRVKVEWIDLKDVESPGDTLRQEGFAAGAALFSRGEGMWYGSREQVDEESIYWAATDGGAEQQGQIFRYFPSPSEGTAEEKNQPGTMELYLEPNDSRLLRNCDNITIAEWGDLIICEDTSGSNAVRGVTQQGEIYTLARNSISASEFAGACFSPDFSTLFVNIMNPGVTLAITGPWRSGRPA